MTFPVRQYTSDDQPMVEAWWKAHKSEEMPVRMLPPLGVIVSDADGPAGALWAYECAGCPVCFLEFPVTRPGLGVSKARDVLLRAVEALEALAGKGWSPPGVYSIFRCFTMPAIARTLKKIGFMEAGNELTQCLKIKTDDHGT